MSSAPFPGLAPAAGVRDPLQQVAPDEGRAILRAFFAQYRLKRLALVKASFGQTTDLFESQSAIPDGEVESFRKLRPYGLERFDKTLCELFERRVVEGRRRKGRRPDADASLASLRVLSPFDHDRQAARKNATRFLARFTHREMAVGTWLAFTREGQTVNARLTWVSPLRTKYLFTSRSRARAFAYTPEELAYEVAAGQVALVVEPVPLFDRAVSAALETLAARQPSKPAAVAVPA